MAAAPRALLTAFMLISSLGLALANLGDNYVGVLAQPSTISVNRSYFNDTAGGYGSANMYDTGVSYSWEVDLSEIAPPLVIQLVLMSSGFPVLTNLTGPNTPVSPDGINFGTIEYTDLQNMISASANPSASLGDGSIGVVAQFAKPKGSALMTAFLDGNAVQNNVYAPPSPPNTTPPAPDPSTLYPGETPTTYFSQLDGTQIYMLQTPGMLPASANATTTVLLYKWKSGVYTWSADLNGVINPGGMALRVFVNLTSQPLVLNLTSNEDWSPTIFSYDGNFTEEQLQAGLKAAGRSDAYLDNTTPDLYFQLIDLGGTPSDGLPTALGAPAPAPSSDGSDSALPGLEAPAPTSGSYADELSLLLGVQAPAPAPSSDLALSGRRLHQQPDPFAVAYAEQTSTNGTCGGSQEVQIIGFIYNAESKYKLKPILKDSSSIPSTVKDIPLYISAGILGIFGLFFITNYVSNVVEISNA